MDDNHGALQGAPSLIATCKATVKNIPVIGTLAKPVWKSIRLPYRGAKSLKNTFLKMKKLKRYLHILSARNQDNSIVDIAAYHRLLTLLDKVEYYQPLYNLPLAHKIPQRICYDRADAIYQVMKSWGVGARILDMGCSLGYFVHYFGERGYKVDGIDSHADNVAVCNMVAELNQVKHAFSVAKLDPQFLQTINANQYDVGFLFSVAHHIIYYNNLEYTQQLMAELLEKIPVLFIELAIKDEETASEWRQHLPDDELSIFAKCDNVTIERLGYFSNHLSLVRRPLFLVRKVSQLLGEDKRTVVSRKFTGYQDAPYLDRQFFDCGDQFIKKYFLNTNNRPQVFQEIKNYQLLPVNHFLPKLISYHENNDYIDVIFSKIPGENVHDLLVKGMDVPKLQIFTNLVFALDFLFQHGLYHNDIRLWNMMYDGKQGYLFDLGLSSEKETENTNDALLWIIALLHRFTYRSFPNPLTVAPNLKDEDITFEFVPIVKALQQSASFAEFIDWFDNHKH
jgi:2-polyprenyl-3-methyl-5-hydroxy-6-metoxy-1,4-benzoquinol methylase